MRVELDLTEAQKHRSPRRVAKEILNEVWLKAWPALATTRVADDDPLRLVGCIDNAENLSKVELELIQQFYTTALFPLLVAGFYPDASYDHWRKTQYCEWLVQLWPRAGPQTVMRTAQVMASTGAYKF